MGPARTSTVVDFPGTPSVVVRLHSDGQDDLLVEDVVELGVPREDTVAVVEELLAGHARRRVRPGLLWNLVNIGMHNPSPSDLVVTVLGDDGVRVYDAPITLALGTGPWLAGLPLVEDTRGRRGRGRG